MKIASITWARNEEDIIETFVRYHCTIVQQMHIIDNNSNDQTWNILKKLQSNGLPIILSRDSSAYHRQAEALTALIQEIAKQQESLPWIIPLDADEFLCTTGDPLHKLLTKCAPDTTYTTPWRTYVPTPSDHSSEPHVLRRIQHRRSEEPIQFSKVLIPPVFVRDPHIRITEGGHSIYRNANAYEVEIPAVHLNGVFIAHFPVRSERQLRRKIIDGWQRHRANPKRKIGQAFHWEKLYDRCKAPEPMTAHELQEIACNYATKELTHATSTIVYDPLLK